MLNEAPTEFIPRVTETNHALAEIPVIDIGPYLRNPDSDNARAASEKLSFAQENIGFFFIINHGIDAGLLGRVKNQLEKFFSLPIDEKMKIKVDKKLCGYVPPKSTVYVTSKLNRNTKQDLNETLLAQRKRLPTDRKIVRDWPYAGLNKWPEKIPEFGPTMEAYFEAMEALGRQLVRLYALALGKEASYFDPFFSEPHIYARLSHYPPVQAEENQFGIAPHCDHGFLTLLPVFDVPGLQILTRDRQWIPCPIVNGGILVNTGEALNRLSNDRFIATPHRVIPPDRDRYSAAVFVNPNDETSIKPLDTCVSKEQPPKYGELTFLEYFDYYMSKNYLFLGGSQLDHNRALQFG